MYYTSLIYCHQCDESLQINFAGKKNNHFHHSEEAREHPIRMCYNFNEVKNKRFKCLPYELYAERYFEKIPSAVWVIFVVSCTCVHVLKYVQIYNSFKRTQEAENSRG